MAGQVSISLMLNHCHLVVETLQPSLVVAMKWLGGSDTGRFNRRHRLFGHLFSGRYKSLVMDGSGSRSRKTVSDSVRLNPSRADLLEAAQPLPAYAWSSWLEHLTEPSKGWPWLWVDRLPRGTWHNSGERGGATRLGTST